MENYTIRIMDPVIWEDNVCNWRGYKYIITPLGDNRCKVSFPQDQYIYIKKDSVEKQKTKATIGILYYAMSNPKCLLDRIVMKKFLGTGKNPTGVPWEVVCDIYQYGKLSSTFRGLYSPDTIGLLIVHNELCKLADTDHPVAKQLLTEADTNPKMLKYLQDYWEDVPCPSMVKCVEKVMECLEEG